MMTDILDFFIHAIDKNALRWFGESPVLVEVAVPDTVLCLNPEILNELIECHLNASLWVEENE